eukprot:9960126-Alexandrium_andersonii.AAC.1
MSASLVGSEMCIRDRRGIGVLSARRRAGRRWTPPQPAEVRGSVDCRRGLCLLYTSDAADDM